MKIVSICPLYKKIIYISDTYIEKPSGQTGGQTVGQTRKSHFFVHFLVPLEPFLPTRVDKQLDKRPKTLFLRVPDFHVLFKIRHLRP